MTKSGLVVFFLFILSNTKALDFVGVDTASLLFKKFSESGLSYHSFQLGMEGYKRICDSLNNSYRYLCIADFAKPSSEKRLYVFDMRDSSLFLTEYVTHGKKSGELYAEEFSNVLHSNKSSLGFYLISEAYTGKHGLSIRLDGLDYGFNDKARDRNIVMHPMQILQLLLVVDDWAEALAALLCQSKDLKKSQIASNRKAFCLFIILKKLT